jgi:hypothetical protein
MQNELMRPPGNEGRQDLWSPLRFLKNRPGTWALFVAGTALVAVIGGTAFGRIFTLPDVKFYLEIAQGNTAQALQPFASRQLGPLVCRAIAAMLHVSKTEAFVTEGVASLLVLFGIVGLLLLRTGTNTAMLCAIGGLAFWAALFNGLALPDLWYAALLSIFVLLLYEKHFLAAAVLLFPFFSANPPSWCSRVSWLRAGDACAALIMRLQ